MQLVDKQDLIMWSEGVYLEFKNGKGYCVNEIACQAAQDALDRGEIVGLTVKNRLVSYVKKKGDGYYEQPRTDAEKE